MTLTVRLLILGSALGVLVASGCVLSEPLVARPVRSDQVHRRIKQQLVPPDVGNYLYFQCRDMVVAVETGITEAAVDFFDRDSGDLLAACGGACMLGFDQCKPCETVMQEFPCEWRDSPAVR